MCYVLVFRFACPLYFALHSNFNKSVKIWSFLHQKTFRMSQTSEEYVKEHKLKQLMEFLLEQLVLKRPKNPEKYLITLLERRQHLLVNRPKSSPGKSPSKRPTQSLTSPRSRTYEKPWLANSSNMHSSMPKDTDHKFSWFFLDSFNLNWHFMISTEIISRYALEFSLSRDNYWSTSALHIQDYSTAAWAVKYNFKSLVSTPKGYPKSVESFQKVD